MPPPFLGAQKGMTPTPFAPTQKLLRSNVITHCFLSAKVVKFNFSRNIMQTEYTAPTFCLYECNRFQMYC